MAEILIVVALLVILMGISLPAVVRWQNDLNMTRLDNHAKTIFLEAQNQLSVNKAAGGLERFASELGDTRQITQKPQDFGDEGDWQDLYYLYKSDTTASELIPTQSNSYQMAGDYVIEFNPRTGDIYGVFY